MEGRRDSVRIDFAELLVEEVSASVGGVIEPIGEGEAMCVVEKGVEDFELFAEACHGSPEVVAVIQEDVSPEGAVAACDSG